MPMQMCRCKSDDAASPGGQAGRAHNAQNLTGLTASGYVQAVVRVAIITPNGVRFSFLFAEQDS